MKERRDEKRGDGDDDFLALLYLFLTTFLHLSLLFQPFFIFLSKPFSSFVLPTQALSLPPAFSDAGSLFPLFFFLCFLPFFLHFSEREREFLSLFSLKANPSWRNEMAKEESWERKEGDGNVMRVLVRVQQEEQHLLPTPLSLSLSVLSLSHSFSRVFSQQSISPYSQLFFLGS